MCATTRHKRRTKSSENVGAAGLQCVGMV